tara:strand:+ start:542 stop:1120 length:579 start_codon:yes stop_codon:yes gene_type:complete
MSSDFEDENVVLRRGFPVWDHNPSRAEVRLKVKERPVKISVGSNLLLINGDTSEILGEGTAAFLKKEVVDDERFMKVFVGQLQGMFDLTKTGKHIFQIVWDQVQDNKDKDTVFLKPNLAKSQGKEISERVFQKGVRELLEKKFIYMGVIDGHYYINMSIFFNGNRIIAATEYIKSSSIKMANQHYISNDVKK